MASLLQRAVATGLAIIAATPAASQSFHFEDGRLSGWLQGGTAFRQQPTYGNNIAVRRPGESAGQDGDFWIGTFEARPSGGVPLGATQGDAPTGTLISPVFTVQNNSIELLVGGGRDPARLRVDLAVESTSDDRGGGPASGVGSRITLPEGFFRIVASATGADNEEMRRVAWDTRPYAGRRARIVIVDDSSAPWGHINVDDIRPSNRIVAAASVATPPLAMPPTGAPVGGGGVYVTGKKGMPLPPSPGAGATERPPVAVAVGEAPPPWGTGEVGRFRVTAMQFAVEHQTYDTITEDDGRGDEVWVQADIFPLRRDGGTPTGVSVRSARIGERGDLVGGSGQPGLLSANRQVGGFVTGDIYPLPGARPRPRDLPLLLWEGELRSGGDGVLIIPTIWEDDGVANRGGQDSWGYSLRRALDVHRPMLTSLVNSPPSPGRPTLFTRMRSWVLDEGSRPIGMWNERSYDVESIVKALVLNYERAQALSVGGVRGSLSDDMPNPESRALLFGGRGDVVIRYLDREGLDGQYALLIHVERID